eukprot:198641_1
MASINAETNHFIGTYDSPLGAQHMPYPINRCVNTGADLSGALYGVFSCHDGGDTVTHVHYGTDSSCQDTELATVVGTYSNDDGLSRGDLFSFHCEGTNAYLETESAVNDPTCDSAVIDTKVSTDVCFRLPSGDSAMITCSETEGVQYSYSQSDGCLIDNRNTEPDYHLFADDCVVFADYLGVVQIYTVVAGCVHHVPTDETALPYIPDAISTTTARILESSSHQRSLSVAILMLIILNVIV